MKKLLITIALMLPTVAFAQWRVGVNAGADYNHYSINTQFQSDYQYKLPSVLWDSTISTTG